MQPQPFYGVGQSKLWPVVKLEQERHLVRRSLIGIWGMLTLSVWHYRRGIQSCFKSQLFCPKEDWGILLLCVRTQTTGKVQPVSNTLNNWSCFSNTSFSFTIQMLEFIEVHASLSIHRMWIWSSAHFHNGCKLYAISTLHTMVMHGKCVSR